MNYANRKSLTDRRDRQRRQLSNQRTRGGKAKGKQATTTTKRAAKARPGTEKEKKEEEEGSGKKVLDDNFAATTAAAATNTKLWPLSAIYGSYFLQTIYFSTNNWTIIS